MSHDAIGSGIGAERDSTGRSISVQSGSSITSRPTDNTSNTTPTDPVNHPSHYTSHPSGIECITITEHMNFNLGNAMKYIWRAGDKGNLIQDLQKAQWYLTRELQRLGAK